ncbi:hypothetical protein SAMN05216323_11451, partial [Williamwhitmania taraxaci]
MLQFLKMGKNLVVIASYYLLDLEMNTIP